MKNKSSITKEITLLIPLRNLGWKYNGYLLDKNIKLRFVDEVTENTILEQKKLDHLKYKTILVYRHYYETDDGIGPFGYIQKIEEIIIFLQLYVDRNVYYEKYFRLKDVKEDDETFDELEQSKSDDAPDLKEKWLKYKNLYKEYKLSFDWYGRSNDIFLPPRESILFLVLALEGILLKDMQTELSYKFALRGAF